MHSAPELTSIALIAVAATLCGIFMMRMKQPAIIGYILCGLILGPSGLGLVENRDSISFLAELGIILLLYFVGMELSLRSFLFVWRLALFSTLVQISVSILAVLALTRFFDWPITYAVLFGFCLALSSTAVCIKVLDNMGQLRTRVGRITMAILIAQDLAVAPMLVIVSNLAGGEINPMMFVEVGISIAVLVGLILFLTRRKKLNLPYHKHLTAKTDITPLAALTWCFAFATLAGLFGMSPAFGAFLAGLVVGNSQQRNIIHEKAEPVQAILLMVFFLSIGLLIDIDYFINNFGLVILLWAFVMIFKTALNMGLLRLQGESWKNAAMVSLVLGQMGEFSFILGAAAEEASVIEADIYKLIVIVTVMSLITSPIYIDAAKRLGQVAEINGAKGLMRKLYWHDWQVTKATSRMMWQSAFHIATILQIALDKLRNQIKGHQKKFKAMGQSRVKTGTAPPPKSPTKKSTRKKTTPKKSPPKDA